MNIEKAGKPAGSIKAGAKADAFYKRKSLRPKNRNTGSLFFILDMPS